MAQVITGDPRPRTLIRAQVYDQIFNLLQTAVAGTVLRGVGPATLEMAPFSASEITTGTLTGAVGADIALTIPSDNALWVMKSTGSGTGAADTATWIPMRDALAWLRDTRESSIDSCVLKVDVREDVAGALVVRSGIHVDVYSRVDRGESSAVVGTNSGGGGCITGYTSWQLKPTGKQNYMYTAQGAAEFGTDNMSQALYAVAGYNAGEDPADLHPTLTAGITNVATSLPLSSTAKFEVPGSAVPQVGGGVGANWPGILYGYLNETEVFSYTGGGKGAPLTGVVRGVNTTAVAHLSGVKVRPINPANAGVFKLGLPISKGIVVVPVNNVFDTRKAFAVGNNVLGAVADTSTTFWVQLNGDMLANNATFNTNVLVGGIMQANGGATVGNVLNVPHIVGTGSAPSIALGTGAGTGGGTAPTTSINGTDLSGVITVTTGTQVPAANAIIATVTFAAAFAAAPKSVPWGPWNAAAAALSGVSAAYVNGSETTAAHFVIRSQGTPLAVSTAYQWQYGPLG